MTISIRDKEHARRGNLFPDRYNRNFLIHQGWNDLHIPMDEIESAPAGRKLDISNLTTMVIFAMNLPEPGTLHLDHVRLIK